MLLYRSTTHQIRLIGISDTRLADRTARLQSAPAAAAVKEEPTSSPKLKARKASREAALPRSPTPDAIAKVRQDLSEAQRSRGLMETKLQSVTEELNKLKMKSSFDSKRIKELTKEKATLATGLRDRDEELRGKTKLLEVRVPRLCWAVI
jgi:chromosome segregation ATPase